MLMGNGKDEPGNIMCEETLARNSRLAAGHCVRPCDAVGGNELLQARR